MKVSELEKMSKKDFKKLHGEGALLLIGAPNLSLEKTAAVIQGKLDEGVNLSDYARNTTRADVDGANTSIWYDEANSVIYATTEAETTDGARIYSTVVYLVEA